MHFWDFTPVTYINETISEKFNERDVNELYSKADPSDQKFADFAARCQNGPSGPYLKYVGTSSTVRDLVSLGDAILGQGQPINYWGISYGTVIGFNFINSKSPPPGVFVVSSDRNLFIVFPEVRSISVVRTKWCTEYGQRVGRVVLDGVVDPTSWITYKVTSNTPMTEATSDILH